MTSNQNERTMSSELVPVKFSRLTRRGILLGLSLSQLITLAVGILSVVGALYAGGGILLAYTAPIWVLAATLTWTPISSRPAVEWLPVAFWWFWRSTGGQLLYRRRIVTPRPVGTLALPGDTSRLREYTDPETNAGMVHDPRQQTLTVVCEVTHPAFVLLDPGEQERRVTSWGRVLATVCRSGRIATLQVLERTLPDSGTGLAEWWASHGTADGTWAATTYAELIERAGPAGERHATTLSLSLDMKTSARQIRIAGGGIRGAAAVLRQEMNTLVAALRSADLAPTGWLTPGEIAVILRSAYDPAIAATLERHGELGQSLATAGPVAVNESWTRLRTDSAHHAVLWVSEWPRSLVYPGFLSPVLLSTGIQRSFSMICTPMRSDQAARDIRKKKVEHVSDAAQRAKIGQIEDAAQSAEYQDVLQQEADLTAGHGVLRYTGLISISAPTVEELEAGVAAIEQAAIQASCETRLLVGQQAAAFTAAALPLCRRV
ncbi:MULTISPECIES: SCO6880 family protein [unclassified Microbacterium]|uniref:SCO6880 family protein n=1 Tax=unclassified Microbacterium TaxID=2609290 RepID=UPI000EAA385C|nr:MULTISPECIES: SCO6880 family protein [unclassified Microbacterium]MBT2483123.1 PrgI family protein [Microbacterium sp. ISL-108]RKN66181.1 PrgI family protein [Microbacterium sp. CGR2]